MPSIHAFLDELTKIGRASRQRNKSRAGRRSMHVDTMLRKEKEGSLYKYTKLGEAEVDEPDDVEPAEPEVEGGRRRMLSEEEAAQIAAAAQGIPLDLFQTISKNIHRVNEIPEAGLRGLMPQVQLPRSPQPSAGGQFLSAEIPEKFAAINNRWLERGYTEGERGLQNSPVTAKKKPGDSPTTDTASAYGKGSKMTPTWTPPATALPSKLAELGRLVKSPTDTHPTRDEGVGSKRLGGDQAVFRHQYGGHDPRPITEVESDDVYSRA